MASNNVVHKNKMLEIGNKLTQDNIAEIRFFYADTIGDHILEEIKSGLEMIKVLERVGIVGEDNYKELVSLLEDIGRKDLVSIIGQSSQPNWDNVNNRLGSLTNPTNATYNDALSPDILDKVAFKIATDWCRFGRHLNMKDADLEHIDNDYRKTHDKSFQLIKLWKQKSKEGCLTWPTLKKELEQFQRFDIIRELQSEFKYLGAQENRIQR